MKKATKSEAQLDRRLFLQTTAGTAGALVLGFKLGESSAAAQTAPSKATELNAFIAIAPDNTVTLQIHKSEMGQGVVTSLSQILIDELDGDWNKLRTEFPGVKPVYGSPMMGTYGSLSIRTSYTPLRNTAAAAREMLVQTAATRWGVAASACKTENGSVVNTATNARLTYGDLAADAAKLPVPARPTLKTAAQFKLIGTSPKRLDTKAKVTGTAQFGLDMRLPGMLYASLERCPVFEGKVASFDATAAKAVPGVKQVFAIERGVAVVGDSTWSAMRGRKALKITWNEGARAGNNTPGLRKMFADLAAKPGTVSRNAGNVDTALTGAARKVEAVYEAPYLSHAPMEPLNATVLVTDNHCDVWVGSQIQTVAQQAAQKVTGLRPEQVEIHTQYLGGGFGRRGGEDYIDEAVEIAKHMKGTPVKLTWTREDDLQHDTYRPMSYTKFSAGLDADGWPVALHARIVCPPFGGPTTATEGIEDMRYSIANVRIESHAPDVGIPVNYWRSVGYSQNTFFMESFVDELAASTNKDPVEFRRKLLTGQPRMLAVLNLAAEKAGWGTALPAGRFRGVAVVNNIGSYNAQVAEISVTAGKIKVHKIVCAVDCGVVVNPAIVQQQIESGIVYGLSAALKQAITLDKGRVVQQNFNSYDPLRIDEMPQVEVHIVASTAAPGGIGEASTPTAAPAVINAVYAATRKRVRMLPVKAADLA
ncbi:MAG: xanthine dehydrogenase family protein molybdopterin-binding subunit [Acidobacteriota bacterium]